MNEITGTTILPLHSFIIKVEISSKHVFLSDAPSPNDHFISAHAVYTMTSVSGVVRTSRPQPKILDIQSEVVDMLEPRLRENFGDQSCKIGPKEKNQVRFFKRLHSGFFRMTTVFSISLLRPNNSLSETQGGTPPSPQLFP